MSANLQRRAGGEILVDALKANGVKTAFGVPGESYLAVLDALHDTDIDYVICRQEGGAAMMADAYGKLTGEPGICMVTRGPGATNASAGVHIAYQDSTPMILLIGQVGRDMVEREAFQEIDYRRMFGQMAKWIAQIDDAARIPEYLNRAFHTATSGRPGPVVLALPEDMLTDYATCMDAPGYRRIDSAPPMERMAELREMLSQARRPMMIVGGGGWNADACRDIMAFAQANHLATGASFRCQDYFDNLHPCYVGHVGIGVNPKLAQRVKEADLLIVAGARLGEMTTSGYSLLDIPVPQQKLVHIHADASELNRVYAASLAIHADPRSFAKAAAALERVASDAWSDSTAEGHRDYQDHCVPAKVPGDVQMGEVMLWLRAHLDEDSILCNGAGNYAIWLHRFYQYRSYRTQLAPTSGSMGYGVPAAIAAKHVHPDRTVVALAGDGCYMMHGQELATAVQYDLPVIFIVVNNGMFGTIRMHQEREYPERISGTQLKNPDFCALAKAYGAHGELVTATDQFALAFERAQASGKPALIEIRVDPEALTPNASLSEIRAVAKGR
ncbi:thiamine pyrophosphate-binding protein [Aestuariispira insulae]|nr:thiamine pyrophosphate-binding protein [Aestuariispira insulae]